MPWEWVRFSAVIVGILFGHWLHAPRFGHSENLRDQYLLKHPIEYTVAGFLTVLGLFYVAEMFFEMDYSSGLKPYHWALGSSFGMYLRYRALRQSNNVLQRSDHG